MEYQDRQITCIDCAQPFLFSAGEQEFYARKGFREEPKRCKPCRDQRKLRRDASGPMPRANGGGNDDGNRSRGNGNAGGRDLDDDIGNRAPSSGAVPARGPREVRDVQAGRGTREMFDAVCASCGAATRVPFRPVAGRPVYCRDCYSSQSDGR
jgi:CxxC-x17-CxxC domain-containing protein